MKKPRRLKQSVTVTSPQLTFLLTLLQAKKLPKANNEQIFPADEEAFTKVLEKGKAELQRDRWLVSTEGYDDLNTQLLQVVAAMANPIAMVASIIAKPDGSSQIVTHYVGHTVVVEQIYTGQKYQLTFLASVEVLVSRLATTLMLPTQKKADATLTISEEDMLTLGNDTDSADVETLTKFGLTTETAHLYLNTLQTLSSKILITVSQMDLGEPIAEQQLGLIISNNQGNAWLAEPMDNKQTTYQMIDMVDFQSKLHRLIERMSKKPQ
jgi:hypothetical protein